MKILIFNRREFHKFMEYNYIDDSNVESKDLMIISINQPFKEGIGGRMGVYSYFKRQHSNVMIMHFPDYGEDFSLHAIADGDFKVFNEYKAKKLYEFIKKNKDKSMAVLHCLGGISRSFTIGTFIHDLYGTVTWDEFKRKNPQIQLNQYVLKLLHNQHNKNN